MSRGKKATAREYLRIVDDWIRLADTEGVTLPPPERTSKYSGRFVLRVPAPVHQAPSLQRRRSSAAAAGVD